MGISEGVETITGLAVLETGRPIVPRSCRSDEKLSGGFRRRVSQMEEKGINHTQGYVQGSGDKESLSSNIILERRNGSRERRIGKRLV